MSWEDIIYKDWKSEKTINKSEVLSTMNRVLKILEGDATNKSKVDEVTDIINRVIDILRD